LLGLELAQGEDLGIAASPTAGTTDGARPSERDQFPLLLDRYATVTPSHQVASSRRRRSTTVAQPSLAATETESGPSLECRVSVVSVATAVAATQPRANSSVAWKHPLPARRLRSGPIRSVIEPSLPVSPEPERERQRPTSVMSPVMRTRSSGCLAWMASSRPSSRRSLVSPGGPARPVDAESVTHRRSADRSAEAREALGTPALGLFAGHRSCAYTTVALQRTRTWRTGLRRVTP
jgi:hypothetical protein